jgi:hypothetical protein
MGLLASAGEISNMTVSRSQTYKAVLAVTIVSAAMALAIWEHFANPSTRLYAPVIQLLTAGQLDCDEHGHIDLARQFPGLTPHDEMFVTRRDDRSFLALFPTYYGRGTSLAGLMYSSRPLQDEDTYSHSYAITQREITVASWTKLAIDKRLDDHWYMVSHNLH